MSTSSTPPRSEFVELFHENLAGMCSLFTPLDFDRARVLVSLLGRLTNYDDPQTVDATCDTLSEIGSAAYHHVRETRDGQRVVERVANSEQAGYFRSISSRDVVVGLIAGDLATRAPERFLQSLFAGSLLRLEPSPRGVDPKRFSAGLYWFDLGMMDFPSWQQLNTPRGCRLRAWTLARIFGILCWREMRRRLEASPLNDAAVQLAVFDERNGLETFIRHSMGATISLYFTGTPTHKAETVEELVGLAFAELADGENPWEIICRAMDGYFGHVPNRVIARLTDLNREMAAQKRGPEFEHVSLESSIEAATLSVPFNDTGTTFREWQERVLEHPDLEAVAGPAAPLIRFLFESPEAIDLTAAELADRLHVSLRTIQYWKKALVGLGDRL